MEVKEFSSKDFSQVWFFAGAKDLSLTCQDNCVRDIPIRVVLDAHDCDIISADRSTVRRNRGISHAIICSRIVKKISEKSEERCIVS